MHWLIDIWIGILIWYRVFTVSGTAPWCRTALYPLLLKSLLSRFIHNITSIVMTYSTTFLFSHLVHSLPSMPSSTPMCRSLFFSYYMKGSYLGRLFSKGFDMNPHHALPSTNVIENPIPALHTPPASMTVDGVEVHATSLPLIPPFRIPWKVGPLLSDSAMHCTALPCLPLPCLALPCSLLPFTSLQHYHALPCQPSWVQHMHQHKCSI